MLTAGFLYTCALFLAGLAFGSFLNVCITRIPRDESVVRPGSHCRACGAPIRWWHNVPVLGFLVLRGRCRDCGSPISLRYPAVEVLTAVVFAACYPWFGLTWMTLKFCVFGFLLVGLIFMDAETGLLPHEFTYPGIVLGLAFAWVAPGDSSGTWLLLLLFQKHVENVRALALLDSAAGALVGAAFFYFAWAVYWLVRKRHGLGFGDVALIAMTGAFLGLKLNLVVLVCGPILTLMYAIVLLIREAVRPRPTVPTDEGLAASTVSTETLAHGREVVASAQPESPQAAAPQQTATMGDADAAPDYEEEPPFLQRELPFGVFLGICALGTIFFGEAAWAWYLGRFHSSVLAMVQSYEGAHLRVRH